MTLLKYNIIANFVGRAWTNLMSILFVPVYLHFVGVEGYGLIGFFTLLQSVLGFMDLGIGAALNREMARLSATEGTAEEQRDLLRTLELIYWCLALIAGALVVIVAPYLANHWIKTRSLPAASVLSAVRLMGIAINLQFPTALYQAGLMGLQKQVLVSTILVVAGTLRALGAALVLWLFSPTVEAFLGWQLIVNALASSIFLYYLWRSLPASHRLPQFNTSLVKGIWKYAAVMGGNAVIGVALTQLDKVILSNMLTLEVFGYYVLAGTVAAGIWSVIVPFNSALFPRLVQLHELRNFTDLSRLFHYSSQTLSVVLLPITAVLALFAHEILVIWTRSSIVAQNAHTIASFLIVGVAINGITSVPAYAAAAFGWPQLITYTNLTQALMLVPLTILMTKHYGAIGAATAFVVLNCTYLVIMMPVFFGRYFVAEKWQWCIHDALMPLIGALGIATLAYYLMPPDLTPFGVVAWISVTFVICLVASSLSASRVRNGIIGLLRGAYSS